MKYAISIFLSWIFAVLFSVIGVINCFFGNDSEFGIFILFLSLLFYPPIQFLCNKKIGWTIPKIVLISFGLFILWASLGVGELLNKIQLMLQSFLG